MARSLPIAMVLFFAAAWLANNMAAAVV